MLHPFQNLGLAGEYLATLPEDNKSKRYYNGEVFKRSLLDKVLMFGDIKGHYEELSMFYPFTKSITKAQHHYLEDEENAFRKGAIISATAVFTIFQLARRGKVLPVLSQYGKYFKTHRVFRQYVWALALPTTLLWTSVNLNHIDEVFQLWSVHSRRMNSKIQDDPTCSIYPPELKEKDLAGPWNPDNLDQIDIATKFANETLITEAPDYVNPEFEAVEIAQAEGEDGAEDEAEEEE